MKKLISAIGYHSDVYIRTTRYVVPCLLLLIAGGGIYSTAPVRVADSYAYTMAMLFFCMVCIGVTATDADDPVADQLLVLRLGSLSMHVLAKLGFLLFASVVLGILTALFPLLMHVAHGSALYKTPLHAREVLLAIPLHTMAGFLGAVTGSLFHPSLMRERKLAMLAAGFMAVMGFIKIGLHRLLPWTVTVTWILPPISDMVARFTGLDAFPGSSVAAALAIAGAYALVVCVLQVVLISRRKF